MKQGKGLLLCILFLVLWLVWRTIRSLKNAWGNPAEEVRIAKLPRSLEEYPRVCHRFFVLISAGVFCFVGVASWLVMLCVLNNYTEVDYMETPSLAIVIWRNSLRIFALGVLLVPIGYLSAAIYAAWRKE